LVSHPSSAQKLNKFTGIIMIIVGLLLAVS